jgi:hypothetical protein
MTGEAPTVPVSGHSQPRSGYDFGYENRGKA